MGHRYPKPGDVKTTDAARLQAAVERCIERLRGDLRVEAYYETWVAARRLDQLQRRALAWADTPQSAGHTAAFSAALFEPPSPAEKAELWTVLQGMRVLWPWTTAALFVTFPRDYLNVNGAPNGPQLGLVSDIELVKTATPGRLPPEQGERIRRHVDWWYRWRIKIPRDELTELEAEELARTGQTTVARRHSTVIQGVQHVERLLEVWTAP
jgi:hypothetical protein